MRPTEHIKAELDERSKLHNDNFKPLSPFEGAIIRGHLLVEQELIRSIELAVPNKKALEGNEFSFYNKVVIADMLSMLGPCKKAILDLNTLRNKVAHTSKRGKTQKELIISIISEINKIAPEQMPADKSIFELFLTAVSFLCGFIAASHQFTDAAFLLKMGKPTS